MNFNTFDFLEYNVRCFLLSVLDLSFSKKGLKAKQDNKDYYISYMNQVLKSVIQFVYCHQTVFSNNFFFSIYKITLQGILNS